MQADAIKWKIDFFHLQQLVLYLPFGLGGLIISGTQLIVVSGVHHIFNLLEIIIILVDKTHSNMIITAAMTAQGAAAVAVVLKQKESN